MLTKLDDKKKKIHRERLIIKQAHESRVGDFFPSRRKSGVESEEEDEKRLETEIEH